MVCSLKKNKLSNGRIADSQCDGLVSVIANTDAAESHQMLMDIPGKKLFSLELLPALHGSPRSMCSTFDDMILALHEFLQGQYHIGQIVTAA